MAEQGKQEGPWGLRHLPRELVPHAVWALVELILVSIYVDLRPSVLKLILEHPYLTAAFVAVAVVSPVVPSWWLYRKLRAARNERDEASNKVAAVTQEREALQAELQKAQGDRNGLKRDLQAARNDEDSLAKEAGALRAERDELRRQLQDCLQSGPAVWLGDVHATILEEMINTGPVYPNPVPLTDYILSCKILGSGERLDAQITFTFKGRNLRAEPLIKLILPIISDHFVKFNDLQPKYFDVIQGSPGKPARHVNLDGTPATGDRQRKDFEMEFDYKRFPRYQEFWIDLKLTWPAFFNRHHDYLFLDTTPFEDVEHTAIELDLSELAPSHVLAYAIDRGTRKVTPFSAINSPNRIHRFVPKDLEPSHPMKDTFYALVVEPTGP